MSGMVDLKLFFYVLLFMSSQITLAEEMIVVEGSTTIYPVIKKCAVSFMKENKNVKIAISSSGSGNGIKSVIDGTADIATSSRFLKEKEIKLAIEKGGYPVSFCIAYDCIVPIANNANPLKNISLKQLEGIYIGKIRNWHGVNGRDAEIKVISRDSASGTYEIWNHKILSGKNVLPAAQLAQSNEAVIEMVRKDVNAIGYVGLGYVNHKVNTLSVEKIAASERTALDGQFPINRPLYLFTKGWPKGYTIKFINYILDPLKGQRLVKSSGYVGLYLSDAEKILKGNRIRQHRRKREALRYRDYKTMVWAAKIKLVQEYLNDLDYDVGPIDGIYGPHTAWAIRKFQTTRAFAVDGQITYELIQEMESALSSNNYLFTRISYDNYPINQLS